jgi:PAS domain S-box-containing protein
LALEAGERRLAEAQRIAGIGSFELDLRTGDMTWSDEHYRILGLDPALEPTGELFTSMVHPGDLSGLEQDWANATRRGLGFDRVYRIRRADGEERWIHGRAVPELADDGTVVRLVGTLMDDTERVEAERVRQAADTRFEIGFEQSGIGAAIVALDGVPIRVNHELCTLLGRPAHMLINRLWRDCVHPDDPPLLRAVRARVASSDPTPAWCGLRRTSRW